MINLGKCLIIDTEGRICEMLRVGDADWDFENPITNLNDIILEAKTEERAKKF